MNITEYYRIEERERLFSMLTLSFAVVPLARSFFKSLFSSCSPEPLFRNFL